MAKVQTNPPSAPVLPLGVDLHLELGGSRRRVGLTNALRDAVRSGRLPPGTRLPASRSLAIDLGVSRSTVTEVYAELVAEGWLTSRQGSGTRVAERAATTVDPVGMPVGGSAPTDDGGRAPTMQGLVPGAMDFAEFPRLPWLAAARRALATAPPNSFGYGDPLGRMELRTALAEYLARVRGVRTDADHIVITAGFHHGLGLLARALRSRGAQAVAVEAYGLALYRDLLQGAGLRIPPLAVDAEGARTHELLDGAFDPEGADAVLLTPAHQFPTGFALSPERRTAVLDWARRTDGLVLEDDYDGEFRYDRRPIGALQGLDPERVVYFGTASKSLAPALRVAWMAVPDHILADVAVAKGDVEQVSVLEQATLAEFITSGAFDRHVRSRRHSYRRRREQLVEALARRAPGIRVAGLAAGLQAVLELPRGTEERAVALAAERGLGVVGSAWFRHPQLNVGGNPLTDALVVNYSALSDAAWPSALDALCTVLAGLDRARPSAPV